MSFRKAGTAEARKALEGLAQAIQDSLGKLQAAAIQIRFVHVGVGNINSSDVLLAEALYLELRKRVKNAVTAAAGLKSLPCAKKFVCHSSL